MATRVVLRVFISSTAVDLRDYRNNVRDAVLRLENLPMAMETFSAQSGQPVAECMRMAADADAVICIVAHRYGYVPPPDLGGDGDRSITWLEVDAAKRAGKPVFAFLVDSDARWTAAKEQDRLISEPPEKVAEIVKAVQKLKEFKAYLGRECICQSFTNPHNLAEYVAITLAKFAPLPVSTARVWRPLFCHALQPAQHFRGRAAMLEELKNWLQSPVTPDRVVSVVAAGGTGKTALVNKALHETRLSDHAGVFVWSFYEDPRTDAFLRAAYVYFTGEKDAPTGGMLESLQLALTGDAPHTLILDGLERVQRQEGHHRRGELEDLQLKRLVRALAGGVGSARALVTSRFPLVDLESWTGAGHRAILLDDLERTVALDVLRGWGVKSDDDGLTKLIEPLNVGGFYHALSVSALGSYLGNYPAGPTPKFSVEDAKGSDPKTRRLTRILEQYAEALTAVERDLLARLALFPYGVKVEVLGWILQFGDEVAGALIGLVDRDLVKLLERLKALGLVFQYEIDRQPVYSAHPFLRDFFRNLLSTEPKSVHESVRAKLAPSLETRPSTKPSDPAILDQYELLIEQTLLAGRVQQAFELYWDGLGGYRSLGRSLGENARGLRILERFAPQDDFILLEAFLPLRHRAWLTSDLGLYARNLGYVARARKAFSHSRDLSRRLSGGALESIRDQYAADLELNVGGFPQALDYSESAVSLAIEDKDDPQPHYALACRATAYFGIGEVNAAAEDFERANRLNGRPLYSLAGIWEAESKLLRGDRTGALSQTRANREFAVGRGLGDILCRSNTLLARLFLSDDLGAAAEHLQAARSFANHSGHVELQLGCFHAACDLQRHLGNFPQAIAEAEAGILLADTCSFGKYSIDLRLALAETYLAVGGDDNARKALQNARYALDRSERPDCQYAWGKADGLHFCGVAHLRLGERELAHQRLTAALELRERLGHGRMEDTRCAFDLSSP